MDGRYWLGSGGIQIRVAGLFDRKGKLVRHLSTALQVAASFLAAIWLAQHFMPTTYWYEYKSIIPVKPVFRHGDTLKMISNIVVQYPGMKITWDDQLRCIGETDEVVKTVTFPGALKGNKGAEERIPWTWGSVPDNTPAGVPCYIRSIQTLTVLFGIERTTVVYGGTFTVEVEQG